MREFIRRAQAERYGRCRVADLRECSRHVHEACLDGFFPRLRRTSILIAPFCSIARHIHRTCPIPPTPMSRESFVPGEPLGQSSLLRIRRLNPRKMASIHLIQRFQQRRKLIFQSGTSLAEGFNVHRLFARKLIQV